MEDKAEINRWSPVEIKTILVPTDLRPESMVALRYALTLAKQFDANLTLLHVLEEPYSSNIEVEPGVEGSLDPDKGNEERAWLCWRRICARSIGTAEAVLGSELLSNKSCRKPRASRRAWSSCHPIVTGG